MSCSSLILGVGLGFCGGSWNNRRDVLTWDGGNTDGDLNTTATFTANFEMQADVVIPDETVTADYMMISGNSGSTNNYFGSRNTGLVVAKIAGTASSEVTPVTIDPFDGKVHRWLLTRVGTTGTLKIDGITQTTWTVPTTNSTWDIVASTNSTYFFAGEILNIKYTDAGTVVQDYDFAIETTTTINSTVSADTITLTNVVAGDWENFTYNSGDVRWEGETLEVDKEFDTACGVNWICGTDWLIATGVASKTSGTASSIYQLGTTPVVGARYLRSVTVSNYVAGAVQIIQGGAASSMYSADGAYSDVTTAATLGLLIASANATVDGDIDDLTAVKLLEIAY